MKKTLIIGSGPAGYSAAIYAVRAGIETTLITGDVLGGQLTITTDVENYPGFTNILGPELMQKMHEQAIHCGVKFINGKVFSIEKKFPQETSESDILQKEHKEIADEKSSSKEAEEIANKDAQHAQKKRISFKEPSNKDKKDIFQVNYTDVINGNDSFIFTNSIIISTGAQAKHLGLKSEQQFLGHGVSMCATCDGFFYKGKEVLVVGGGNSALEEAHFLSSIASKITLIHRRNTFRGEKVLQDRVMKKENIEILFNSELNEVLGQDNGASKYVTGAKLICNGKEKEITCDGVFIAIGHKPSTAFLKNILSLDDEGYINLAKTNEYSTLTTVNGIFAAGDVCDKVYRQAITSAGMGCMAALDVDKWLSQS